MLKYKSFLGVIITTLVVYYLYSYSSFSTGTNSDVLSLKELLKICVSVAEMGGEQVRVIKETDQMHKSSKGKTKEGVSDLLTEGDIRSHETIVYGLKKVFPTLKIISEEHDTRKKDDVDIVIPQPYGDIDKVIKDDEAVPIEDITVWVDPLDATKEYTENLLHYVTTMVCVAVKGKPIIGVIHRPFLKQSVWGWVGHGVSPNLHPASLVDIDKPVIIVSRSHSGKVKDVSVAAFGKEVEVTSAGGAGFKTLQVIDGNATAYIHITLIKKWDICAGNALLNSVGGKMTTLEGKELQYDKLDDTKNEAGLLATMYNHEEYLQKLQDISH